MTPVKIRDDALRCPCCNNENLHHSRVEVFNRPTEDADSVPVVVEETSAMHDRPLGINPSSRRNGLLIYFWCETCPAAPALSVCQHKGTTYVAWAYGGR